VSSPVVTNFMKQQGFAEEPADACQMRFGALYFQPRIVFPLVLVAIVLQSVALFLLLALVLAWNVALPRLNPFERAFNLWLAGRRGGLLLTPAPGPRRFAQGMAAAMMLGTAIALRAGMSSAGWALEGLLVIAFAALLFGRFCLGAYVFHLLRGEVAFANSTLPWSRRPRHPDGAAEHLSGAAVQDPFRSGTK
jgi:uncharacterized protein DUF4395